MTTKTKSAAAALAAARQVTAAADNAVATTVAEVQSTANAIDAAEAAVVELLAGINNGLVDASPDALNRARAAIEKAKRDHQWAELQHVAAEAAHHRARDAEAQAQRALTADEYRSAHREYNRSDSPENVLIERIRTDIAEAVALVQARMELHDRLSRDVQTWPIEERQQLMTQVEAGKPITSHGTRGMGSWTVQIPVMDVAESISAAVADAAERARAEAQARANAVTT